MRKIRPIEDGAIEEPLPSVFEAPALEVVAVNGVSAKVYAILEKNLVESAAEFDKKGDRFGAMIAFGGAFSPGGTRTIASSYACHSYVNAAKGFVTTAVSRKKHGCKDESFVKLMSWVISDKNPLSGIILNRGNLEQCLNYGLILDLRSEAYIKGLFICKLLRKAIETPDQVDTWAYLVERGVSELLAVRCAEEIEISEKGVALLATAGEHCNILHKVPKDALRAVVLGKIRELDYCHECGSLFSERLKNNDSFVSHMLTKKVEVDDGWGGKTSILSCPSIETLVDYILSEQEGIKTENGC